MLSNTTLTDNKGSSVVAQLSVGTRREGETHIPCILSQLTAQALPQSMGVREGSTRHLEQTFCHAHAQEGASDPYTGHQHDMSRLAGVTENKEEVL